MKTAPTLIQFVQNHRHHLAALAQAWLDAGASTFGICGEQGWLAVWPQAPTVVQPAVSAPLIVHGDTVAELWVIGIQQPGIQTRLQVDADMLLRLAGQEADLERMTNELLTSQDQLLALFTMSESMRSRLHLDDALAALTRESGRALKAEAVCAYLVGPPPLVAHDPQPVYTPEHLRLFLDHVQQSGGRFILNAAEHGNVLPHQMQHALIEPVTIREKLVGILIALRLEDPFGPHDTKLMRAICDQAAAQFENVMLYEESLLRTRMQTEMQLAKDVQLHLLPQRLPLVPGLDIAAAALPALQVGGDFYDFIEQPGEPFIFAVGDVTGKGMPAAMLMAMIRTLMRSKARGLNQPSPLDVLGALNDEMYDDFTEIGMFATAFIGQYDAREQVVYYANAGHSPVIYCPAGGTAQILQADGTAIGVLPVCNCENQMIPFHPGDVLIVGTDGFSEAHNAQAELFGNERLCALVESLADQPAQQILNELYTVVAAFSAGHAQDDDQTVIILKGVQA
jgi:sigma-B regulation protein RsbU (phosphoserine phosphatase)